VIDGSFANFEVFRSESHGPFGYDNAKQRLEKTVRISNIFLLTLVI
jgi:hypothetical protein